MKRIKLERQAKAGIACLFVIASIQGRGICGRVPRQAVTALKGAFISGALIIPAAAHGDVFRPIDASYHLTFDDEFVGSALDRNKWVNGWFPNSAGLSEPVNASEAQGYDAKQVSVNGGMLRLSAISRPMTVRGKSFQYRSGMVTTSSKFGQAFGYFEARICLPARSSGEIANWPAFWLDGHGTWPNSGELDIMEGMDGRAYYHFHSPQGGPGEDVPGDFTGCHVYGALWLPGSVTYYYDGIKVGNITKGITADPQFLLLNYALGSEGGRVVVPATMSVDYVRVWAK